MNIKIKKWNSIISYNFKGGEFSLSKVDKSEEHP